MLSKQTLIIAMLSVSVFACTTLGPRTMEFQRNSYTEIIALSEKQELLANIVRAKYNDPPVFLQIKTITVAPSLRMQSGMSLSYSANATGLDSSIGPSVEYKEEPRIIFAPLSGAEFANELLLPTGLMPLYLMMVNGFKFDKIANLGLVSINDISNHRAAPEHERVRFRSVVEKIQTLIDDNVIYVSVNQNSIEAGLNELSVNIKGENGVHPELTELMTLLNVKIENPADIKIKIGQTADPNHINVHTRSILAIINYLSNYVETPNTDKEIVWETDSYGAQNRPITIKFANQKPADAHVAVSHRGHWFFIEKSDIESQNSLYLLQIMFDLQAERDENNSNLLLTLPLQ